MHHQILKICQIVQTVKELSTSDKVYFFIHIKQLLGKHHVKHHRPTFPNMSSSCAVSGSCICVPASLDKVKQILLKASQRSASCFTSSQSETKPGCAVMHAVTSISLLVDHHRLLHLSLKCESRWDTTDDFTTSFLQFPCSPLPSGTGQTPGLSIP